MNKRLKRSMVLILVLIMGLGLLAACAAPAATGPAAGEPGGGAAPAPTPAPTAPAAGGEQGITVEAEPPPEGANLADHINVIVDLSPVTVLNQFLAAGATGSSAHILNMLQDKLIELYGPGDYRPGLATRWVTEDFQTIRFYLRENVVWHNGDSFTAECVVFTHQVALDNPGGQGHTRWRPVSEVIVVDSHTIDVVLSEPNFDFEFEFSHWAGGIVNRRAFEESQDDPMWAAVGTGPFRLVDFMTASHVTLERFDNYWGDTPPTRSITLWTIPEFATRMVMLNTGDAQFSFAMNAEDLDALVQNPDFNVIRDYIHFPVAVGFNNQGSPLMMDTNFRLAVAHALNLDDIAIVANGNWAAGWPDGNVWGLRTEYRRDDLPRRAFNPALAMEYLERSIWNGESIEIATVAGTTERAAEFIQLQLSEIGIDVEIDMMDVPSFADAFMFNPASTREMFIFGQGFSPSAISSARSVLGPGSAANRSNLYHPYFTALLNEMGVEPDRDRAREIAYDMQQFLWENVVLIPAIQSVHGFVGVPGVGGIHLWGDSWRYNLRGIYWDMDQTPERLRP